MLKTRRMDKEKMQIFQITTISDLMDKYIIKMLHYMIS